MSLFMYVKKSTGKETAYIQGIDDCRGTLQSHALRIGVKIGLAELPLVVKYENEEKNISTPEFQRSVPNSV